MGKNGNRKYNRYEEYDDYYIGYTEENEPFIIDKDDYDRVNKTYWRKRSGDYFGSYINGRNISLQRFIMGEPEGMVVDHINHHPEDNRKTNLRIITRSQNSMNQKESLVNTSGVKGVSWNKVHNLWDVRIGINRKMIWIGKFKNFEKAVQARKDAEKKYFGKYSYDNSMELANNMKQVVNI